MFIASAIFLFTINVYSAAYFDILKNRFETLCEYDQIIDKKISFTETEDLYFNKLVNCIREHELLIQYVNKIDYLYRSIMFVQVFSSVMQICFSGFQILLVCEKMLLFVQAFEKLKNVNLNHFINFVLNFLIFSISGGFCINFKNDSQWRIRVWKFC